MKPLLVLFFALLLHVSFSQSLDYISVRKKDNRVVKNFYAGSAILLQTTDDNYLQGPVNVMRNDSLFLTIYDIRMIPTTYGGFVRDTLTTTVVGIHYKDIKRIYLNKRRGFFQRSGPALLMVGGGSYFLLNLLNSAYNKESLTSADKARRLGFSAGLFGLGYPLQKLFHSDGFSKSSQRIVYVNLSPKKV